jgi:hypothetical protein
MSLREININTLYNVKINNNKIDYGLIKADSYYIENKENINWVNKNKMNLNVDNIIKEKNLSMPKQVQSLEMIQVDYTLI